MTDNNKLIANIDDIYRENILEHYKHPRNFGKLKNANSKSQDNLVSCGDNLSIQVFVKDDKLQDIKFEGKGCAVSIASASMLTEFAKGKKIPILKRIDKNVILKLLQIELSVTRLKCALLSVEVLKKALQKF